MDLVEASCCMHAIDLLFLHVSAATACPHVMERLAWPVTAQPACPTCRCDVASMLRPHVREPPETLPALSFRRIAFPWAAPVLQPSLRQKSAILAMPDGPTPSSTGSSTAVAQKARRFNSDFRGEEDRNLFALPTWSMTCQVQVDAELVGLCSHMAAASAALGITRFSTVNMMQ